MLKVSFTFFGDFIKETEVEYYAMSNLGNMNGENTTLSPDETVQKENINAANSKITQNYSKKIQSELKSTITKIGEVEMSEA